MVFEGTRAVGVEYLKDGQVHVARARKEVILSGGAYGSPATTHAVGHRACR